MTARIDIPTEGIQKFCEKWKITEFSLFGSVLRDDFASDSDIDVLVRFHPEENWNLLDMVRMEAELKDIFNRSVDLVEEDCLENPYRKRAILSSKETVYAA